MKIRKTGYELTEALGRLNENESGYITKEFVDKKLREAEKKKKSREYLYDGLYEIALGIEKYSKDLLKHFRWNGKEVDLDVCSHIVDGELDDYLYKPTDLRRIKLDADEIKYFLERLSRFIETTMEHAKEV